MNNFKKIKKKPSSFTTKLPIYLCFIYIINSLSQRQAKKRTISRSFFYIQIYYAASTPVTDEVLLDVVAEIVPVNVLPESSVV